MGEASSNYDAAAAASLRAQSLLYQEMLAVLYSSGPTPQHVLHQQLLKHYSHSYGECFRALAAHARRRAAEKRRRAAADAAHTQHLLASGLRGWHRFWRCSSLQQTFQRMAGREWRTRLMRRSLKRWRSRRWWLEEQVVQLAACREERMKAALMKAWRAQSQLGAALALRLREESLLRLCMRGWRKAAQNGLTRRCVMAKLHREVTCMAGAVERWTNWTSAAVRARDKRLAAAKLVLRANKLKRLWSGWHQVTRSKVAAGRALQRMRARAASVAVRWWAKHAARRGRLQRGYCHVKQLHEARQKQEAMGAMRQVARLKQQAGEVLRLRHRTRLEGSWRVWRKQHLQRRMLARFRLAHPDMHLLRAWRAWRGYSQGQVSARRAIHTLADGWCRCRKTTALSGWVTVAKGASREEQSLEVARCGGNAFAARAALTGWRDRVTAVRAKRQAEADAKRHSARGHRKKALRRWCQFISERKQAKRLLARAASANWTRSGGQLLRKLQSYREVQQSSGAGRAEAAGVAKSEQHWKRSCAVKAFSSLAEAALGSSLRRGAKQRALWFARQSHLLRALVHWVSSLQHRKVVRRQAEGDRSRELLHMNAFRRKTALLAMLQRVTDHWRHKSQLSVAHLLYKKTVLPRTLRCWQHRAMASKNAARSIDMAGHHLRLAGFRWMMNSWRRISGASERAAALHDAACLRDWSSKASKGLQRLQKHRRLACAKRVTTLRQTQRSLYRALNLWRLVHCQARAAMAFCAGLPRRRAGVAFANWHHMAASAGQQRRRQLLLTSRRVCQVRASLRSWLALAVAAKKVKAKESAAREDMARHKLEAAVKRWCHVKDTARLLGNCLSEWKVSTRETQRDRKAAIFGALVAATKECQNERDREAHSDLALQSLAFEGWVEATRRGALRLRRGFESFCIRLAEQQAGRSVKGEAGSEEDMVWSGRRFRVGGPPPSTSLQDEQDDWRWGLAHQPHSTATSTSTSTMAQQRKRSMPGSRPFGRHSAEHDEEYRHALLKDILFCWHTHTAERRLLSA
ncbi:unnamed protein product [Chrysoparadoxa australica]